ncbi:MAG: DNA polymerase III subunit delta, partial [Patescibacteria group bacterium]
KTENVELLVRPGIDLNIFDMVDALGQKNKSRVLKLFSQHIEKGEDEFYLLSMFIYQIRNLLRIKSTPIAKLDLHPFVIRKTLYQVKNFTFEELKKIYYQLMTIDLEAKTGKTDIMIALELFLAKI